MTSGKEKLNLFRYIEHWVNERSLNIVIEYCDGGDLSKAIKQRRPVFFDTGVVLNWVSQLLAALKYLHDKRIYHRDIKVPHNFNNKSERV